ncbi:NADP-dependent oxidoreductase [Rhodococcus sp. JVH1]|uniref:NADP-dependent oxidoreductase n=1 Tax=Rhodococcus sp. JVH1 TaxID=745408 RepID=UPI000A04A33C|nr:NADP-dependent oxidoreductase [Rhodococcus sp. JVH1]
MTLRKNRKAVLASRPLGLPNRGNFRIIDDIVGELGPGQALVENQYLSVDPAMRGWVSDESNYADPVAIGAVMRASAVGRVVSSRSTHLKLGEIVVGRFGWQEYAIVDDMTEVRVVSASYPPSLALGALGANGVTAWLGFMNIGQPKRGDVVVVSTAAGAVGSLVGQLARLAGCRTIGIVGSDEKADICLNEFGYDVAINYKSDTFLDHLEDACADGVDIYFDNTSGRISDAVMGYLNKNARIIVCGTAAIESWDPLPTGPRIHRQLLTKRARMEGFLLQDHSHEFDSVVDHLTTLVDSGALKYREHVLVGIERAPEALELLLKGGNLGKTIIQVD